MAQKLLSLLVLQVFLFLLSASYSCVHARPLPPFEHETNALRDESPLGVINGLVLDGMKNSGPSPGGGGHKFTATSTLGGIKDSGPSPQGPGHRFVDPGALGGIKNSGPSSGGGGHAYSNADILGGIKHSGPSPGGGGHELVTAVGGIKASGPSPKGGGHKLMTLGGSKQSMMRLGRQ